MIGWLTNWLIDEKTKIVKIRALKTEKISKQLGCAERQRLMNLRSPESYAVS